MLDQLPHWPTWATIAVIYIAGAIVLARILKRITADTVPAPTQSDAGLNVLRPKPASPFTDEQLAILAALDFEPTSEDQR